MSLISGSLTESTLFGIRVCAGSMASATDAIIRHAKAGRGGMVCVANVDMVTRAKQTPRLKRIMAAATLVVTDGMPLVWALRKLNGLTQTERVNGPLLTLKLCARAEAEGLPVFFYGGTPSELERMLDNLRQRFPALQIAGAVSPPMLPSEPPLDERVVEVMNESGAGIVFVGLGCPKQEFWMEAHRETLKAIAIGVGFAFALIAGTKKEAPHWMQRNGLEWLFRLCQEPGRLWKRYLVGNSYFIAYVLADLLSGRRKTE
jgi:N-acetylglucosaminyldiphosphoundecaprenol N-acetyl-beta-D-mannosaminyltransferase